MLGSTPITMGRRALLTRAVLAVGVLMMLIGSLWAGLIRIGWALPAPQASLALLHGPLFVCGMLGTVIGVERAVALGRPWAFGGPLLTLAGGVGMLLGLPMGLGALLMAGGSLGLLLVFGALLKRQPARFVVTMALGAAAWLGGNLLWLAGRPLALAALWWAGFLILTIVGERLELGRLRQLPPRALWAFTAGVGALLAGLLLAVVRYDAGVRLTGAAWAGLALWLLAYDIARRTLRRQGVPRFSAVCILSGSVWLGVGGLIAMGAGAVSAGPLYDALLHTVFVDDFYVPNAPAFEAWATLERERMRQLACTLLIRQADRAMAEGAYPTGVAAARRLLALAPPARESAAATRRRCCSG